MKPEEQLDLWVQGISIHNKERGECCPDFSCCRPELLAPEEIRIAFKNATSEERGIMLAAFLVKALESEGHEVITSETLSEIGGFENG